MNVKRVEKLNNKDAAAGAVVYWMSRDQRVYDNWALIFAQELALKNNEPLAVVFCLAADFLGANIRHYDFMLRGLKEAEEKLRQLNIPFYLLTGSPETEIVKFVKENACGVLVNDFDPLRIKRKWKDSVAKNIDIPFYEVDAHNIVPVRQASQKKEFGAYTIRPKIERLLPEYLEEFPLPKKMPEYSLFPLMPVDWDKVFSPLNIDRSVKPAEWIVPGESAGLSVLNNFLEQKLQFYNERRNDPGSDAQSDLSPYFHFGHISAQRAALNAQRYISELPSTEAFLEELIVRRELADNFCFYNSDYDSFNGFPDWAKRTLNEHRSDKRDHIYSVEEFESAGTHDSLWNAAQMEMLTRGKMHGYMRMYWAKKILEWTPSPEEALKIAIYLNDKYELDGRDPNGYTGIAWSIGGVHDRAWGEREIFGKIRYMSYNGMKKKFDIEKFFNRYSNQKNKKKEI